MVLKLSNHDTVDPEDEVAKNRGVYQRVNLKRVLKTGLLAIPRYSQKIWVLGGGQ